MNNEALQHWISRTKELPHKNKTLNYSREFSEEEYTKISKGVIPLEMEDKWFIHLDDGTLNIYRSWTGHCIYSVQFEKQGSKYLPNNTRVNRERDQYINTDDKYDLELLDFIISNFLLGEAKPFPKKNIKEKVAGVFQHHISGTAYPEKTLDKPWWKFWK